MKWNKLIVLGLVASFFVSCQPEKEVVKDGEIQIAFYNVENLFDTADDPRKFDEEFTPNGRNRWTNERYDKKLTMLTEVLSAMGQGSPPAIIGMCEIENKDVLEDMLEEALFDSLNYGIVHRETIDGRGIDQGILYNKDVFEPIDVEQFRISFPEEPDYSIQRNFDDQRYDL